MPIKKSSSLSVSVFLLLTLTGCLLIQGVGHYLNISLVRTSLPLAAIISLGVTYGYFFTPSRKAVAWLLATALVLGLLGTISISIFDMSSDGLGYQQPGAETVLNGWNPLHHDNAMLWVNIYPSGTWELEAALAALYGSIEAAKMHNIWWVFITLPMLLAGLRQYKGVPLTTPQYVLALLIVFSPLVLGQMLTHYLDGGMYLTGVVFLSALLLHGEDRRQNQLAFLLMGASLLCIVNAKLSGLFHAVFLCGAAVLFFWMRMGRFPYRPTLYLFCMGLVATFFLGFHPYVTNFLTYGSYMHVNPEVMMIHHRPANLDHLPTPLRFFYSLFSATGGHPRQETIFKYPWQIAATEWNMTGTPDTRLGGFGVWFGLGFIGACLLLLQASSGVKQWDRKLLAVAAVLFASSLLFPESWWARYVPFANAAVFLVLLALPEPVKPLQRALQWVVVSIFIVNSSVAAISAYNFAYYNQRDFVQIAESLRAQPVGSVYIVPPGDDYLIYNQAHLPLQRRLKLLGVENTLKVDAPCPNLAASFAEYKICY